MYQSLIDPRDQLSDAQRELLRLRNLQMCSMLGLNPESVKADSFEVMALADDTIRVRWTGLGSVPRKAFLAQFPDAKVV